MKRKWIAQNILAAMLLLCFSVSYTSGASGADFDACVETHEPQPYGGVSLQETTSFQPVPISPAELTAEIAGHQSPEETTAYLRFIGLPFDENDGEYVYHYRNQRSQNQFVLNIRGYDSVTTVSYAYDEENNDNIVFVFMQHGDTYLLTDCIANLGNQALLTAAANEQAWLVGDTGTAYRTIRWYNLFNRNISLRILAQGAEVDPVDYHVQVNSAVQPPHGTLPENDTLTVLKQVCIVDFTISALSADAPETLHYTQVNTYVCEPNGDFTLHSSQKLENADIPSRNYSEN